MPETKTLHDAFIDELRDVYDAEKQIIKALPKVIKTVSSEDLREGLQMHFEETKNQVYRLEQVFESIGEKARGKHCDGMAGILEEGKTAMEEEFDDAAMDAVLTAGCQRVEHYEITAYGTLVAWAKSMGHDEAADLLQESLDEEKAADEKLTKVAEGGINQVAAGLAHPDDEDAETEDRDERPARRTNVAKPAKARNGSRQMVKAGGSKRR
jgi:ferritin-like metal-binding protein YciE